MSTCFTPKEWETIRGGATDQDQIDLFFVHWSLKESYIKAVGYEPFLH
jgi:4'-phosphopantetheinyl transferase